MSDVNYGARFRHLRKKLWSSRTMLELARKLGSEYPSSVYNIERQWRVPTVPTIGKHAAALGCRPWDLLVDVETEYDLVRQLADIREAAEADRRWRALLLRYKKSTLRVPGQRTTSRTAGGSVPQPGGQILAEGTLPADGQTHSVRHPAPTTRGGRVRAGLVEAVRTLEQPKTIAAGRKPGTTRQSSTATRARSTLGRVRHRKSGG